MSSVSLLERGFTRGTVDRSLAAAELLPKANPVTLSYNHQPPFSLSSSDSFESSAKRDSISPSIEERGREISSIGQQCHIVRPVCVRIASGRQRVVPLKGEETRIGGVGIYSPSLSRSGLMEIEGRTECFSSRWRG